MRATAGTTIRSRKSLDMPRRDGRPLLRANRTNAVVRRDRDAAIASNYVGTAIYRFERLAAQNSKFVKYGAGGEEVRYRWGTGGERVRYRFRTKHAQRNLVVLAQRSLD
jgi:hypothetical protein